MPMKMSAAKKKFGKARISGKQRVARIKNIEVARRSRKKGVDKGVRKKALITKIQRQQTSLNRTLDSGKGDAKIKMKRVQDTMGKLMKMGVASVKGVYGRQ
jgi:hypothetical protein